MCSINLFVFYIWRSLNFFGKIFPFLFLILCYPSFGTFVFHVICVKYSILLVFVSVLCVIFGIIYLFDQYKTWSKHTLNLIKNILIRRKESDTYLATISRHRWSSWITMKRWNIVAFSRTMAFISWRGRLFSWWRLQCRLKATIFYNFSSWSTNSKDVYWQLPGRCRSLSFLLIYFLCFVLWYNVLVLNLKWGREGGIINTVQAVYIYWKAPRGLLSDG